MSLASLPADVVWNLTKYVLSSYEGPFRPGDEEHGRVLDLLRVLSVDKAARSLYAADPRFKALVFCTLHHESIMSFDDRTENGSDGWSDAGFERRMGRPRRGPRLRPPAAWGQDRALVLAAVKIDGHVLLKADAKFREDKDIVLISVREDDRSCRWEDRVYAQLPESLRRDHDVVRAALANACRMLGLQEDKLDALPAEIRDDKQLMLEVMRGDAEHRARRRRRGADYVPLFVASERLRNDRDVVLAAVSQREQGSVLRPRPNLTDASDALRDDRAVVEAAVRATRGGFVSLAVASERLRNDLDLAALAVSAYEPTYEVRIDKGYEAMSERVRSDRALFLELVAKADHPLSLGLCDSSEREPRQGDSRVAKLLAKAADALQGDKEAVLAAVAKDVEAIYEASDALQQDGDVLRVAIASDGRKLELAPPAIRGDKAVVLRAVRQTGSALEFASDALRDDYDVCFTACTNEGAALEWVSRRLRDDRSIRAAARAERAALIASVGGVDNLDYFWARQDKTRQQRDRERRAANFGRRPAAAASWVSRPDLLLSRATLSGSKTSG